MRLFIPLIAIFSVLGASQCKAHDAGPASTTNRFEVRFSDLNLNDEQDARVLLQRIERAAKKACGGHASFSSYTGGLERSFYECRDDAVRRAVEQLAAPVVSRLYREAAHSPTVQHDISTVRHAKTRSSSDPLYFAE